MSERIEDATVVLKEVGKIYTVNQEKAPKKRFSLGSWKQKVVSLKNISFCARAGESIGLIGQNGSGKSTLLRLIAGGDPKTSGELYVKSRPVLLGVSPALQGYLTGRQNVYLGCLALGLSKEAAHDLVPEIIDWADIGTAIDRPMNTYSTGMNARLSFAISTSIQPEILLVDEALSTGDASFSAKANQRMSELLGQAGNLFLVSHSPGILKENCARGIWLHRGEIIADGTAEEISDSYGQWSRYNAKGDATSAWRLLEDVRCAYEKPDIELIEG